MKRIDPDDWCWAIDGWEMAGYGSVQDARDRTRSQAMARYAGEAGVSYIEVGCWKRHGRAWSTQEQWEYSGMDNAIDIAHDDREIDWSDDDANDAITDEFRHPPEGWEAGEDDPSWSFCARTHPDAIPIWICGDRREGAPPKPSGPATKEGDDE